MSQIQHVETFICLTCGTRIEYRHNGERTIICSFCGTPAPVPEYLFTPVSSAASSLSTPDLTQVVKALHKQNKLEAIMVYRKVTNASLEVAKQSVSQIEQDVATHAIWF